MSDFEAIAAVSRTLRTLLEDRMEGPGQVTIAPPDVDVDGVVGERVNLYLYLVSENGWLQNQEIPGEGHPADYGRPPLSLDLSYLVTAHGESTNGVDADLQAQQVLGDAMRVFHDHPIITEDLYKGDNPQNDRILEAQLLGEFESIKIALQPSDIEEFSKIWTALSETNFRRSVAYQVSVVQIESRRRRRPTLPVRRRGVYAFPLAQPHIQEILREPSFEDMPGAVAEVGDTVRMVGHNLSGQSTSVRIGTTTIAAPGAQNRLIEITLTTTLRAGVHSAQVVHELLLERVPEEPPVPEQPLVPHRCVESNVLPLLILPRLVAPVPTGPFAPGEVVETTVEPLVAADQSRTLVLNEYRAPQDPPVEVPHTPGFEVPGDSVEADSSPSGTLKFTLPSGAARIPPGSYLVRVRVDGAESRLTVNPATAEYDTPRITLT